MSVISETTDADAGRAALDNLTCRRQEAGTNTRGVNTAVCERPLPARVRRVHGVGTAPRLLAAKGTRETLTRPGRPGNSFDRCPDLSLLRIPESPTASLHNAMHTVCRLSLGEQTVYIIIAASTLLAAGGGIYWVGKLVSNWGLFGDGIAKLIQ